MGSHGRLGGGEGADLGDYLLAIEVGGDLLLLAQQPGRALRGTSNLGIVRPLLELL